LVATLATVILALPRYNARTRFAVWFSSLIAIAAGPLIGAEWSGSAGTVSTGPAITVPDSWALYLFGAWAVIAAWLLLGVVRSLVHLHTVRQSCVEIDTTTLDPAIQQSLRRNRGRRDIVICTSTEVRVPTALGLIKPAVVIPDWLMQELSSQELNHIVLHELEHLRRWDDWTNLAQQLIKAIFFFHPAVWWIENKVALEREMACDDAVLAETSSPRLYAECLARLAEKSFVHRSVVLAQAALGKIQQTTLRVSRILDPQRSSAPSRTLAPAVSLIVVFAFGCGLWSARASKLIAFERGTPTQSINAAIYRDSEAPARNFAVANSVPSIARLSQTPAPTSAKLNFRTVSPKRLQNRATTARSMRPAAPEMIQRASAKTTAMPVTETIFVVIQNHPPDPAGVSGYQIQMWRLTVFHTPVDPADGRIPRKQI
jgi:beta-lactamase regulating signal transducer with metallopeptidase domain